MFNDAKIVKSGMTTSTYGISNAVTYLCENGGTKTADGRYCLPNSQTEVYNENEPHLTHERIPSFSYGYRLGVRDSWGPFQGVDIGYLWQIPNSIELDIRLGLPGSTPGAYLHALKLGWDMGMYPDNTYFAEYSGGWDGKYFIPYFNFKAAWLATQIADLEPNPAPGEDDSKDAFKHNRRLALMGALGVRLQTQKALPLIDFIHIQYQLAYPVLALPGSAVPRSQDAGYVFGSLNLGIGLEFE
jgi:hypothetical protein